MPTYEYKCTTCEERFEIEQSIHEDTLTTLPGDEHEHQLKKVFSPVGIAFKGDGFYRNDARGGSSNSSSGDDKPPTKVNSDGTKVESSSSSADSSASTPSTD